MTFITTTTMQLFSGYRKFRLKLLMEDIKSILLYDILRQTPPPFDEQKLRELPKEIKFNIIPDGKGVILQSSNVPGLIVSSPSIGDAAERIKEALLVYCDAPRYYILRSKSDGYLEDGGGRVLSATKTSKAEQLNRSKEYRYFVG